MLDIDSLRAGTERAPKTIHNILTLLGSMLRYAEELRWLDQVPRIRKPRIRLCDADYRWLKTDDDIQTFLFAARARREELFVFYAVALKTGMRLGELLGLTWHHVDLDRRRITVERSYDNPTKNGEVRYGRR